MFIILGTPAKFYYNFHLLQVKRNLISSIRNFIFELPQNFPNDLSLGNIGKKDILAKPQNCLGTHPSANSLLQNQFLALALQKYAKADIKRFQLCLFLLDFLRRIGISLHKICENTGFH